MKGKGRRLLRRLSGMLMGVTALGLLQLTAAAGNTDSFQKLNAGAAVVLEADLTDVVTEGPEEASASRNVEEKEERDSKGAAEEDEYFGNF